MIDFGGPWGWNKIKDSSILLTIQERLKNVETMKWPEIENRHNHFIQVKNIGKEAKKRLREINLEDCDTLFSFRVSGKKRLWGIRDNEVLNILWWDPEHTVYPVKR